MAKTSIDQLEGGNALCAWFGGVPSFHDATLRALELRQGAPGLLVAQTFQMESEVDAQGYFVLTKHVAVTLTIFDLIEVELFDFMEAGIVFGLDIDTDDDGVTLSFDSSYGVHGRIKAKRIVVSFEPGRS
jgi:Immunity protein 50